MEIMDETDHLLSEIWVPDPIKLSAKALIGANTRSYSYPLSSSNPFIYLESIWSRFPFGARDFSLDYVIPHTVAAEDSLTTGR